VLSIIIVSYNTRELLKGCLRSLFEHAPAAEIVVVDNASRDGSTEMMRVEFPDVKAVALAQNLGFAAANNIGLKHTKGEFVLLLNSDTYVEDGSLTRCAAWLKANPQVGAVTPRLIGFEGKAQISVHPSHSFRNKFRSMVWLKPTPIAEGPDVAPGWLPGAALMLRRKALEQIKVLLDETYFMYWEDTDLCARLAAAGWKLAVFQDGHVRHLGGGSSVGTGGLRPELLAHFLRGKYRWYARHRPRWERAGLWSLEAVEVVRKTLRGAAYPRRRRVEWSQAKALAQVLAQLLWRALFRNRSQAVGR